MSSRTTIVSLGKQIELVSAADSQSVHDLAARTIPIREVFLRDVFPRVDIFQESRFA